MSNTKEANWFRRTLRELMSVIDVIIYSLIVYVYELFFQVASSTIISGETISTFFGRVQLIFGIFIMFKLAVSTINGIVNPDAFMDKKQGFSQIITRIIVALVMLTLVVPTNIKNPSNHYQKTVSDHGLLFGTLYEVQNTILANNIFGKLILGTPTDLMQDTDGTTIRQQANIAANSIYKAFMTINLTEEGLDESDPNNWICYEGNASAQGSKNPPITEEDLEYYSNLTVPPRDLIELSNRYCDASKSVKGIRFAFATIALAPTVCGIIFLVVLIGFTIDVAIRAIKLAVLRLIAPIPIISYIDPKSQKDGAFSSWLKAVLTTYLDLFIRLAIIYLVMFLIQEIATNGIEITHASTNPLVNAFTYVLIFLGLILFARQAPKFITQALGIKGGLSNIGLSGMFAGAGTLAAGGGMAKAFSNAAQATTDASTAAVEGKSYSPFTNAYAGFRDKTIQQRTGDKNRRGGVLGMLDHSTDKLLANRYNLNEATLDKAKTNWLQAEADAGRSKEIYEQKKERLQSQGITMEFANNNSRNAYNGYVNYDGNRLSTLMAEKSSDSDAVLRAQQAYGTESKAYKRIQENYERKWGNDGKQGKELRQQIYYRDNRQSFRDTIMREQGFVNDAQLDMFIDTNRSYEIMTEKQTTAVKLKKNFEDGKEAYGTMVGKDYAYTRSNRFTPTEGNDSQSGSGGTFFSAAGVNAPGGPPGTGNPGGPGGPGGPPIS